MASILPNDLGNSGFGSGSPDNSLTAAFGLAEEAACILSP